MSDQPPDVQPRGDATSSDLLASGDAVLTPEFIERSLAECRSVLLNLLADPPAPVPPPVPLDLAWLVAQFTALRHDVNLQTKATRNLNDTITQTLKQPSPATLSDDPTRPLLLVLVELADVMANAMVQVRRTQATLAAPAAVPAPAPGFFARLFGMAKPTTAPPDQPKLSTALAGVADGYAMSHRRILQSLEHHGVQPIACVGMPFDPTCMEAVEAVTASGSTSGTVVEEVRAGYRRAGQLFRFAQVKVAR